MRTARRCNVLAFLLTLIGASTFLAGCVQRTMRVESDPPGALVYMNYQEVGRTPFERDFTWYGTYDVQVRQEGYEPLKTRTPVIAPWWQWPPFDLFAEFVPGLRDERTIRYTLKPATTQPVEAEQILGRAEQLRGKLESSAYYKTRVPTTAPASR
jgi:hypothetical protein